MKKNTFARLTEVTGFGLSLVTPLIVCILVSVRISEKYSDGSLIILCGIAVGLISSLCGAYRYAKAFLISEKKKDSAKKPPLMPDRDPNEEWHINKK